MFNGSLVKSVMPQMSAMWWTYLVMFFWFSLMMFMIWMGFWWSVSGLISGACPFFFFFFYINLVDMLYLDMNFSVVNELLVFKFNI